MIDQTDNRLAEAARLLEMGESDRALAMAQALLNTRPGHPLTESLLGLCLFAQGAFDEALKLFEGLLRRNPDQIPLRFNAGLCALREDDEPRAMAHLQRVVALSPGHRRALSLLALLNLRNGQRYVARDLLDRAGLRNLANQVDDASEAEMVFNLAVTLEDQALALRPADGTLQPSPHEGFAEIAPPPQESAITNEWESTPLIGMESTLPAPSQPWRETGPPAPDDPPTLASWPPPQPLWDVGEGTRPLPLLVPPEAPQPRGEDNVPSPLMAPPVPLVDPDLPAPGAPMAGQDAELRAPPAASLAGPREQDLVGLVGQDGPEVEHRLGWLVVRVGAQVEGGGGTERGVIVRGARQVLRLGQLVVRPSTPEGWGDLGAGPTDMVQVAGDGLVALDPDPGATLVLLQLEGEVCRVQCQALLACSGALARRMDRLVPDHGAALPLFHLDGAGFLALRWPAPVQGFRVTPDNPLALRPRYLVAWLGPLRARLTGEPGDGVPAMINLTGTGLALVGSSPQ